MSAPVCDFCCQAPPAWSYPCRDFVSHELGMTFKSTGGWAACEPCHALIQASDRAGLVARSIAGHPLRLTHHFTVKRQISGRTDLFFVNREGEPLPSDPDDWTDPTI